MIRIDLEGGKYSVLHYCGTNLHALRHGEPWRDLAGDGLVLAMAHEIEALRIQRAELLDALIELYEAYGRSVSHEDWDATVARQVAAAISKAGGDPND